MKKHFNKPGFCRLVVCTAIWAGWSAAAQAQSLVELYEAARGFDANYLSARLQFEANIARAEQNRAGMRTTANLAAGLNYTDQQLSSGDVKAMTNLQALSRGYQTQSISASASHPLYRPANQAAYDQAAKQMQQAQALLDVAEQELILRTSQAYFDVLAAQEELDAIRPDLDGNRIMEILGIPPSREVGAAYDHLLELRLDRGPLGEEEAERELRAWWAARQA